MQEAFQKEKSFSEKILLEAGKVREICNDLGYDIEIQVNSEALALELFVYNDAGNLAESEQIYIALENKLKLDEKIDQSNIYSIALWQNRFPYLKISPNSTP